MSSYTPPVPDTVDSDDARTREALESLIDIAADGVEGHKRSAELVEDAVAKPLFELWSRQRADFLATLQQFGAEYDVTTGDPGTGSGTVHRAWLTTLEAVAGDDAVIGAAATGESVAIATYESALENDLPSELRTVVQEQYNSIREIHERLENWDAV
ncbi:MAG: PA2169 family four-helix-bundle protein [Acidimicrobiia bacterium]|nr:PA2169 family four-helix-bundle protein [Acidimicrobiia bacterium]